MKNEARKEKTVTERPKGSQSATLESTKLEEALPGNESRFRALIENSADEIVVLDSELRPIYVSPSVVRAAGSSLEEMEEMPPFASVAPEDQPAAQIIYQELLRNPGKPLPYQLRLVRKDGTWRWTEGIATNLLADPDVQGIILNYRDITERMQAEKSLLASEERYRSLFEDSPISLWEEDFSGAKQRLELLRDQGITDFEAYFSSHPEAIAEIARLVRIVDVNKAARIFAVVDVYDALTSERPYRAAWSKVRAIEHIHSGCGTHFDSKVVEAFIRLMS